MKRFLSFAAVLAVLALIGLASLTTGAPVVFGQTGPSERILLPVVRREVPTNTPTTPPTLTPTRTPTLTPVPTLTSVPTSTPIPSTNPGDAVNFKGLSNQPMRGVVVSSFYLAQVNGNTPACPAGETSIANGIYFLIRMNVTNLGTVGDYWLYGGSIGALRLFEPATGRTFEHATFEPWYDSECLYGYSNNRIGTNIPPGVTAPRLMVFEVANQGVFQMRAVRP